jgi:signal transduction histidine kinase
MRSYKDMKRLKEASASPELTSSTYVLRSVMSGFAAIFMLICIAAGLSYTGIEHIHAEAASSFHSLLDTNPTHSNLDRLIAAQSRLLLRRVDLILGMCELLAITCGAFTIWTVRSNLRKIQTQSDELNLLSWSMSQNHEVVARRFSHEIHDEFGQMLTGLRMMLQYTSAEEFELRRPECLTILDDAIGSVRELSQLLRPVILDDFGLDEALQWMARRMEDQTRISIRYTSQFHGRLAEEVETQLFRVAQESLTNMIRHSKATEAEMHLSSMNNWVSLSIRDNGVGFPSLPDPKSPRKGMGLVGMKARIRHIGGLMKVENQPGGGASLFFSVPCTPRFSHPHLEPIDA